MADAQCIACNSHDLRRDEECAGAWICSACGYENDLWRQAQARRWKARTFLPTEFDPATGALTLLLSREPAERWESLSFERGVFEAGFRGERFVAIRLTIDSPGFERAFAEGFRPFYDQWTCAFWCTAVGLVEPYQDAITVAMDEDEDEETVWVQFDANDHLAAVGIDNAWTELVPRPTLSVAGRMFEMDTGD